MPKVIDSFTGKYRFLSNFSLHHVHVFGYDFPTAEHAFVFAKNPDEYLAIWDDLSPGQVKRKGRQIKLRVDWEDIKYDVMEELVMQKFMQNHDLRKKLIDTGDDHLIEGNIWGDRYWGVDQKGIGHNNLGLILMEVRTILQQREDK